MIASLALTALTAAAPGLQQVTPLDDLSEVPEVLIAIEATGIRARSFCAEPLLLMLATPDRRATVLHCLAPGSSAEGSFPRGALDDAWIEVFLPSQAGWISTGALCLGAAPRTGAWLWVRPGGHLAARAAGYGELDLSGQARGTRAGILRRGVGGGAGVQGGAHARSPSMGWGRAPPSRARSR